VTLNRARGTIRHARETTLESVGRSLTRISDSTPRRVAIPLVDALLAAAGWVLVFTARFDFQLPGTHTNRFLVSAIVVTAVQVAVNYWVGMSRSMWSTSGLQDLARIVKAVSLAALIYVPVLFFGYGPGSIPRSAFVLGPLVTVMLSAGVRVLYRGLTARRAQDVGRTRVFGVGDDRSLRSLAAELMLDSTVELVGLFGTTRTFDQRVINGVPVLGSINNMSAILSGVDAGVDVDVDAVVLGLSTHDAEVARHVARCCADVDLDLHLVSSKSRQLPGSPVVSRLRDLKLEDLLERNSQSVLEASTVRSVVRGKRVLVTGGGGSIGFELVRQIATFGPASLIIFDLSEYNVYAATERLTADFPHLTVDVVLGDVADVTLVERVFEEHRPEIVFHAAAYKHVPILELQADAAVRTNILGTRAVARASADHGTEKFLLISSDKAVRPSSVMGCTKRVAEMLLGALNSESETTFVSVRFGNVLDSSGSVVPKFRDQIARGGPVTVTHPDITRYFMTIPEACELILQGLAVGEKDDILVLDMGEPIKILDLALQMIRLAGKQLEDIKVDITGLRPGEKLYEELFYEHETLLPTSHPRVMRAAHVPVDPSHLGGMVDQFDVALRSGDVAAVRRLVEANMAIMNSADSEQVIDLNVSFQQADANNPVEAIHGRSRRSAS